MKTPLYFVKNDNPKSKKTCSCTPLFYCLNCKKKLSELIIRTCGTIDRILFGKTSWDKKRNMYKCACITYR